MFCVKCGSQMPDTDRFCRKCGAPARQQAPATPQPAPAAWQPVPSAVAQQTPRYAGFWRRFAAALIDGVVFGALWFVVTGLYEFASTLVLERTVFSPDGAGLLRAMWLLSAGRWLVMAALVIGYFAIPEGSKRGASLGKLLLRLRVASKDGQRAGVARATVRTLLKPVSALPLMMGFLIAAWSGRKQALHDMMSGSVVLRA